MREALAHCLTGPVSLKEDAHRERDVDRLHALACAQVVSCHRTAKASHLSSLGKSFLALKTANRPDELKECITRLAKCLTWIKPKPSEQMRLKLARQAIMESVVDMCPTCKGAGEIPAQDGLDGAQRMKSCPECGGHGRRRYNNLERIEAMEIEPAQLPKVERQLFNAFSFLSQAEAEAVRTAKRLLDRW